MPGTTVSAWKLHRNPIFIKCVRTRLRPRHVLTHGLITFVVAAFIFLITFLVPTERGFMVSHDAAQAALLPLIILQGIILMVLGTGSVASGIAVERDEGVLDYQRMVPMGTAAKITGYLFGLPIREYFMFALTLPFVIAAVIVGEIEVKRVCYFYVAFASSVMLYHLSGFCAGMVTRKPRRASWGAQIWVVVLYLILPAFAATGINFLEYLTIRPTLFGMVQEELLGTMNEFQLRVATLEARRWGSVAFFGLEVSPLLMTLLVQGLASLSFLVVVVRKWGQETHHAFSKGYGLLLFTAFQVFMLGSLWPIFSTHQADLFPGSQGAPLDLSRGALGPFGLDTEQAISSPLVGGTLTGRPLVLLYLHLFLSGMLGLLLIMLTTASWSTCLKGWRRARKLGRESLQPLSDAATGVLPTAIVATLTSVVYGVLVFMAQKQGHLELNGALAVVAPALMISGLLIYSQCVKEAWGGRGLVLVGFLLWIVPFLIAGLLAAAWDRFDAAGWINTPSPPLSFFFAMLNLIQDTGQDFAKNWKATENLGDWVVGSTVFNIGLAIVFALVNIRRRSWIRTQAETLPAPSLDRDAAPDSRRPG